MVKNSKPNSAKTTQTSSRKAAFFNGRKSAALNKDSLPDGHHTSQQSAVPGAWSIHAQEMTEQRNKDIEEHALKAQEVQYQGILNGLIPLEIPPHKIEDLVGSDRVTEIAENLREDENFKRLVANMETRGQRIPIRVRSTDPQWRPSPTTPRDITGQTFILQSGRRRLAACKELGIDVKCTLSFVTSEKEARSDDLQERFFENTMRKDLTLIERLYSIGVISNEMPDKSQAEMGGILGVDPAFVSRGIAVFNFWEKLKLRDDLSTISRQYLDTLLQAYRKGEEIEDTTETEKPLSLPELPFKKRELSSGAGVVSLKYSKSGSTVMKIEMNAMTEDQISKIMEIMEAK